jgi:hypothetical protein
MGSFLTRAVAVLASCTAIGVLVSGTASAATNPLHGDPLVQTARLVASDGSVFVSAGISNGVLVAGAPGATVGANQDQGAVYAFNEAAGGWNDGAESARLVTSDGHANDYFGGAVAISGDTVVAGRSGSGAATVYVFTRPAGGWSGTIHESAKLTVADPGAGSLSSVAISGNTMVIGTAGVPAAAAYVFSQPGSGWSGTINESAKLTASGASNPCFQGLGVVAIDGPTIVAGSTNGSSCNPGVAYVFTEPASGWSGTAQESAKLIVPSGGGLQSVAAFGSSVAATGRGPTSSPSKPVVFNKPAGGWSGTISPSATLTVSTGGSNAPPTELVAGSGDVVTALAVTNHDTGCPFYTCDASLYGFTRPFSGWQGTIAGPSATVTAPGAADAPTPNYPLAIDGDTIASGGGIPSKALDVFTLVPGRPSVRNTSLSGLATAKPKLRFTLDGGQSAAPIRSLKLNFPQGLALARHRGRHTPGVRVSVPTRVARSRPGTLTVTLRHSAESVSVTIAPPTLIDRASLIAKARSIRAYNRTHRRKRTLTISIRVLVTDATGRNTPLTLKIRGS